MDELRAFLELLSMLVLDPRTGGLLALLVAAAVIDWRTRRIPNWLTGAGAVVGLLVSALTASAITSGVASSASGAGVALVLLLPLWMLRILGAGDVKLMAMVGAFLGPTSGLGAMLFSFAAGGVLALGWSAASGAMGPALANARFLAIALLHPGSGGWRDASPKSMPSAGKFPYAIGIAVGTLAFLLLRQLA